MQSSKYIEEQRREYSLYVIQSRALPAATDGLKPAGRRVLWVARDGSKYKTANLAGATLPIHPHDIPEGPINTLAAPYNNNIPLFTGYGAFGTLLEPNAYGAGRYTSVAISKFTKDVMFKDIEIIPMKSNYDDTLEEPVHFLPLVPVALLNPSEGIAVGFAANILPRDLSDVISVQLNHLQGKKSRNDLMPSFTPLNNLASAVDGNAYTFNGSYETINATTINITKLPYGQAHKKVINKLEELCVSGTVIDYIDSSKDTISIEVKFKKGVLRDLSEIEILKMLALTIKHNENLNVLDFSGQGVWSVTSPKDLITSFTDWRLTWYVKRYERLQQLLKFDLQRYYDIRAAIKNKVGAVATKAASREELKELLVAMKIVNVDYIADLPVYRFTEDERVKNEQRIKEAETQLKVYKTLLTNEGERRKVYMSELQDILSNHNKGLYNER